MPIKSLLISALCVATAPFLSGCLLKTSDAAQCPPAAVLAGAAHLTQFGTGAAEELSGVAYTADLVGASTNCFFDKKAGTTQSSVTLNFRATRAPSTAPAQYSIPYFVAVTQADRILSKKTFTVQFSFAPGQSVASFSDVVGETDIKLENGHPPFDYQLLSGLQLSPAQAAYNKKMGPYIP